MRRTAVCPAGAGTETGASPQEGGSGGPPCPLRSGPAGFARSAGTETTGPPRGGGSGGTPCPPRSGPAAFAGSAHGPAVLLALALAALAAAAPAAARPEETQPGEPLALIEGEVEPHLPAAEREPVVAAIEIRSDAPVEEPGRLRELVALAPGEPMTDQRVAESLRNLHALGLAGEIEAYRRPLPDGRTVAVFVLWASVQVEAVRLEGELGIDRRRLREALVQQAAQPLVEDRVIRGLYALQDLYRRRGYLDASVRVEVPVDRERKRAEVIYRIASGPRAEIGEIGFAGDLGPFEARRLRAAMALEAGERYRDEVAEDAVGRLEDWLHRQGHRTAVVEAPEVDYRAAEARVDLRFPLEVGPLVEVTVRGADLAELRKRGLLPFLGEQGYDEALVLQSVQRIREWYQRQGHYRVAVDWSEEREAGRIGVTIEVEPGPVFSLEAVEFEGNRAFSDERLAPLMSIAPKKLLGGGSGRVVDAELAADLDNIRSFYALNGYAGTEVGPERVDELEGNGLRLVIPIDEGRLRRVVGLEITGMEHLDSAALDLPLEAAGPFHPQLLDRSLDVIRSRYEEDGFVAAQVSSELSWNDDRTLVDIAIHVLEGRQVRVGQIVVRGNRRTETGALTRWIDLEPGDPVSTRRLLEVQRRLYDLGIFSRVQVEMAAASPFTAERNVVVRVEEARSQKLFYGVGYDSEDGVRGLLGYSHSNLFRRAWSAQADARVSQREQQYRALLRQPFLGRWQVPVTYSLFQVQEDKESFDSDRRGGQVEATRTRESLRLGLLYTYKIVQLENLDENLSEIDRDLREIEIASLTPSLFIDRRDDPLDPTRGWSSQLQLEYAFPFFAATAEFAKAFTQETAYLDFDELGVVAGSFRVGAIEPRGDAIEDPTVPEGLPSALVPISERFFAGGRTSHRAYRRDQLGIRGETVVDGTELGGNGLLLVNLDYRYPISDTVGATFFVDAGNVWADWRDVDPREAKLGVGIGGRYRSPIGPLRLEVGWKLDREPGEDPFVVFLSFGNPF